MAEGINFNSEQFDDDAESSFETDKDKKKKKKKASKDVGAAIVGGSVEAGKEASKEAEPPKKNFLEQMKGWLFEEDKKDAAEKKPRELHDAADIDQLPTIESPDEEAAIARAKELLGSETPAVPETTPDFAEFRTQLGPDEMSLGEGIINLRPAEETAHAETDSPLTFEQSVQQDLDMLETVESPDEHVTVQRAQKSTAQAASSGYGRRAAAAGAGTAFGTATAGVAGGAGTPGGPPAPPNTPPPPPWHNPNTPWTGGTPNVLPTAVAGGAFANMLAARTAFEAAHLANRNRGRVEGLIAGAIIGGGIEHIRHKRRERKMEKNFKAETKKRDAQIEKLGANQVEMARRAEADKEALKSNMKQEAAVAAKKQMEAVSAESARRTQEVSIAQSEKIAALEAARRAKELSEDEKTKAAEVERLNALAREQEMAEAERLKLSDNHLEASAWHTIEVDKAGHAVEQSTLEYGHEYYREKSHETGPKDQRLDSKAGAAAVAGLLGGMTAAQGQSGRQPGGVISQVQSTLPKVQGADLQDGDDTQATNRFTLDNLLPWAILLLAVVGVIWLLL